MGRAAYQLACVWMLGVLVMACSATASADSGAALRQAIDARAKQIEGRLIKWRQDIHQHPELGNREVATAELVAKHLKGLGLKVRTGVARTGVVGVLTGGSPGRVVALRADMDGLPVEEAPSVPALSFVSKDKGDSRGKVGPVMHACGHDGHVAILMATAEILSGLAPKLAGTVVFYFQPAEEGPSDFIPDGKNMWGAKLMIAEGAMQNPRPNVVFGLHLWAGLPAGRISYRPGPAMASSDDLRMHIVGKQTHAGQPWNGIDPIVVSAQVILGLQTIVSRQTDLSAAPAVISLGTIHGGVRYNIIPDFVDMEGTIRAYDDAVRSATQQRVRRTAENIATSAGAKAEVTIIEKYDQTVNDPKLTERSLPSLRWAAKDDVTLAPLSGGAEDFSFMAKEVPGLFFFVGATKRGEDPTKAAPNHSPNFTLDESSLLVGVRALSALTTDFLSSP